MPHLSVLTELPDRQNIRKSIQRVRLKHMPPNPPDRIPPQFLNTAIAAQFFLYESYEDEHYNLRCGIFLLFLWAKILMRLSLP